MTSKPIHLEPELFCADTFTPTDAVTSIILQRGKLQPLPSLQTLKKNTRWSSTWNRFFNPDKSHTNDLTTKGPSATLPLPSPIPSTFYNPLEEVQSYKILGLTIIPYFSWANNISKSASKASRRLGILHQTKSFGTPEFPSTYKSLHPLLHGILLSSRSWLPCLTPFSA